MPWEERRNGRRYYYKRARIEGRPRRIYLGHGPAGRINEILDRVQKREKDAARRQRRELRDESNEQNRNWRELMRWLEALRSAEMLRAGWYRHRGQWRKAVQEPRSRQHQASAPAPDGPAFLRELEAIIQRVQAGDSNAQDQLHRLLEDHPEAYRTLGDLSSVMMVAAVTKLAQGDLSQLELYRRNLDEWRRELLGPDPTAIERGMVEVAVSAKLAMVNAEHATLSASPTYSIASMKARTLERAQHRYAMILKKLEEVRRAQGPRTKPNSPQAAETPSAKAG